MAEKNSLNRGHFRGNTEFSRIEYTDRPESDQQYTCEGTITYDGGEEVDFKTAQHPETGDREAFRDDMNEAVTKAKSSEIPGDRQEYVNGDLEPGKGRVVEESRSQDRTMDSDGFGSQDESLDSGEFKSQDESIDSDDGFSQSY